MRALLASPIGFVIGLALGALGAGGSVLAVPALVYAAGQGARQATATSLLLVGTAALVGMRAHQRAGRVRFRTGMLFGLAGIGGSIAGTTLHRHLEPDALLLAFSGLVVVAAWRMLVGCPTCTQAGEHTAMEIGRNRSSALAVDTSARTLLIVKVLAAGTAVGFLSGLFGVGGGFVIVPALTLVLGLTMPDAIGTSLLVIAINSAMALALRIGSTGVEWHVAVPFTIAAIAGVLAGKQLADRLDPKQSLRWFAGVLVAVAAYTGFRAASSLFF